MRSGHRSGRSNSAVKETDSAICARIPSSLAPGGRDDFNFGARLNPCRQLEMRYLSSSRAVRSGQVKSVRVDKQNDEHLLITYVHHVLGYTLRKWMTKSRLSTGGSMSLIEVLECSTGTETEHAYCACLRQSDATSCRTPSHSRATLAATTLTVSYKTRGVSGVRGPAALSGVLVLNVLTTKRFQAFQLYS